MNEAAGKMSLKDTHYANVTGIDSHNHYTSVWDIAQLSSIILTDKTLTDIVHQKTAVVTDVDGSFSHRLKNTNKLLARSRNVKGLKTGWTKEAGGCLVAYLVRDDGRRLLTVVLGSKDEETRFSESLKLFRWAGANYVWEAVEPPPSIQAFSTAGT
jgi:D-alanyl-D-alanine carboxypeptidase (penicillin-binding protein 5/6)